MALSTEQVLEKLDRLTNDVNDFHTLKRRYETFLLELYKYIKLESEIKHNLIETCAGYENYGCEGRYNDSKQKD